MIDNEIIETEVERHYRQICRAYEFVRFTRDDYGSREDFERFINECCPDGYRVVEGSRKYGFDLVKI